MSQLLLVSNDCIWENHSHAAFTDLISFKDELYCVFREAKGHHQESNGIIRIVVSSNAPLFKQAALLEFEGLDLRDPKLSITPEGQLMLLVGASRHNHQGNQTDFYTMVAFSSDGRKWSEFQPILSQGEWLWRVTWHQGVGFGISYFQKKFAKIEGEFGLKLFKTLNGKDFTLVTLFNIPDSPSEATIRFLPTHEMIVLLRTKEKAWIGKSFPPFEDWIWQETHLHVAGPDFLILPDGAFFAAGRRLYRNPYHVFEKTVVMSMTETDLKTRLILPSDGDCSYPGMVFQDPYLLISYYTSFEISNESTFKAPPVDFFRGNCS